MPTIRKERETIHSGHFMVSDFEAEEQDDEDNLAVPVPESEHKSLLPYNDFHQNNNAIFQTSHTISFAIETNLTKLFNCMTVAYRQKLTSPKWNRFKGVRLRWKEKIRLNNVIWRCWHMQFITKFNTTICQFATPLDCDVHNKPEAIVLEGKYWKRRLAAVTAEYKKWRVFFRNKHPEMSVNRDSYENQANDFDMFDWHNQVKEDFHMMTDSDYMELMSDTLFTTITSSQPFTFPDSREMAKAGIADFIQPSLRPLQPNLEDIMETMEPLQDFASVKLPVLNDHNVSDQQSIVNTWNYSNFDLTTNGNQQVPHTNFSNQITPKVEILDFPDQSSRIILNSYDDHNLTINNNSTNADYPFGVYGLYQATDNIKSNYCTPTSTSNQNVFNTNNYQLTLENSTDNFTIINSNPAHYVNSSVNRRKRFSAYSLDIKSSNDNQVKMQNLHKYRPRSLSSTSKPQLSNLCNPDDQFLNQRIPNNNDNFNKNNYLRKSFDSLNKNIEPNCSMIINGPLTITDVNSKPSLITTITTNDSQSTDDSQSFISPTGVRELKRVEHIQAEQKRRYNIKNGFDVLQSLLPNTKKNSSMKLSKAALLQKGGEYIQTLNFDRKRIQEDITKARKDIESLNDSINNCLSQLTPTRPPLSTKSESKFNDLYQEFVKKRSLLNWKFWIFSLIIKPLFKSFINTVSTASIEELYRTTVLWAEQHCTSIDLRRIAINSLTYLSTKTNVLFNPLKLPDEIEKILQSK